MRNLGYLLFTVILSGCITTNKIIGKYQSKENPNNFLFNSDSTFLNEYREGHAVKYSKGIWQKKANKFIILNTKPQEVKIPVTKSFISTNKSDKTIYQIIYAMFMLTIEFKERLDAIRLNYLTLSGQSTVFASFL